MSFLNRSGLLFLIGFLTLSGIAMMNASVVFAAELDDTDQAIGKLKKDYSTGVYDSNQGGSKLSKEFSDVFNLRNDTQGVPQKIDKNIDPQPTAQGEMAEIERYVRFALNNSVKLRNDYLDALHAIGWNILLDAKRLENDTGMEQSKLIIEKARGVIDVYKAKTEHVLIDNLKAIDTMNISENSKKAVRSGYMKASVERKKQIEELWQLELQITSEAESIIYHLEARRAHWSVQDGQLLFEKQNDLDIYRSYLKAITDLSKRQEDIQKQSFDSALKKLDVIK